MKIRPQSTQSKQVGEERSLLAALQGAKENKLPILYLDEVNFTKQSIQGYDWSGRNHNISIDQR